MMRIDMSREESLLLSLCTYFHFRRKDVLDRDWDGVREFDLEICKLKYSLHETNTNWEIVWIHERNFEIVLDFLVKHQGVEKWRLT